MAIELIDTLKGVFKDVLDLLKKPQMEATKKQLDYIRFIESETGVQYKGSSKSDAVKYISENKGKVPYCSTVNTWALENGY